MKRALTVAAVVDGIGTGVAVPGIMRMVPGITVPGMAVPGTMAGPGGA